MWKQGVRLDRDARIATAAREHADLLTQRAAPPPPGSESGRISNFDRGNLASTFGSGWQPATDSFIGGTSTVKLDPSARGADKTIRIPAVEECDSCHGSGAKPGTQPKT